MEQAPPSAASAPSGLQLQDIAPAPLARAISYKAAGPISALGHQSPTLAQLMARQATLDPTLTRPSSAKRKNLSLISPLATRKKRTSTKRITQARAQQPAINTESADSSSSEQILMDQTLESPSSHQEPSSALQVLLQPEVLPSPRSPPASPQQSTQSPSTEPGRLPSPIQEIRNEEKSASSSGHSFAMEYLAAEQEEEISSGRTLSKGNQAKLKDILSLLNRSVQDQVKDADLLRDMLESVDQELPADIKASLEPISQLDHQFVAVKQALKNQSSQPALEQRKTITKQSMKDLHIQVQNNKDLLTRLRPELEQKKARKAALEAELRTLSAEIEADEKKIAELPESTEKMRKEIPAILNENRRLKTKLAALAKTQEADKNLLANISNMISAARNVISKYLGA